MTAWTVSHILDKEKLVVITKVIPELVNGILSGLKDLETTNNSSIDDDDGDKILDLNRGLKEIRAHFLYILEAHRLQVSKVDGDAANELVEMLTSAILSIISEDISKVSLVIKHLGKFIDYYDEKILLVDVLI